MSEENKVPFSELGLKAPILEVLTEVGYEYPSDIQAEAIPLLLEGHNLLGTAQTGTGKTAAFALPILNQIDAKSNRTQAIVVAPTRELAIQVAENFAKYASKLRGVVVTAVYGGAEVGPQLRALRKGSQVVVGTPGRIIDHLRRGSLKLDGAIAAVLDEADEMLRMGFIDDVESILEKVPDSAQRVLFSATMPPAIKKVANRYLGDAKEVRIKNKTQTVSKIKQEHLVVRDGQKLDALARILEVEETDGSIVFVRTKSATTNVANRLNERGFRAAAISGDLSQSMREQTIQRLKDNLIDIVVATDVAARGIDVPRVSFVFHYDAPYDTESFVHRTGRTGRAGREGRAVLFVTPRERRLLMTIEKATRQKMELITLPTPEQIREKRVKKFEVELLETVAKGKLDKFSKILAQISEDNDVAIADLAAGLMCQVQKKHTLFPKLEEIKADSGRDRDRGGRDRGDRPERGERKERADVPMDTYKISVGNQHRVSPGDIVGAIANEAQLDSQYIGHIALHDEFSTVDLPKGMPPEVFKSLNGIHIRQRPADFTKLSKEEASVLEAARPARRGGGGPRRGGPRREGGGYRGGNGGGGNGGAKFSGRRSSRQRRDANA